MNGIPIPLPLKSNFQEFLLAVDAVTCKTFSDKMRWAFGVWDQKRRGSINMYGIKVVIRLLDQIEENGFTDGISDEEKEELLYKRKIDPLKLVEDRAEDIWQFCDLNQEGRIELEEFLLVQERLVYARE